MSLVKYAKTCVKNISGCKSVFIAEAANVTSVTITTGEITALTGTGAFKQIEADNDTIIREQEKLDSRLEIIEHRIGFKVNTLSKDLNTLRDSIAAASPCGMLAIVVDNNEKAWLIGYSEADGIKRPLYLGEDKDTTFQTPFEDDPSAELNLKRTTGHIDLPFDATLTAAIIAGTAIFIDYAGELVVPPQDDFETGYGNWFTNGANTLAISTDYAYQNSYSLKCVYVDNAEAMKANLNLAGILSEDLQAGHTYTVSWRARQIGGTGNAGRLYTGTTLMAKGNLTPGADWVLHEWEFTYVSGTAYLYWGGFGTGETLYIDDVSVVDITN